MTIQEWKNNVFILGAGGHGIESIFDYILSSHKNIVISYVPVDFGGSTGNLTRVIEFDNNYINNELHSDFNYPSMPFGDYTKFVSNLLIYRHGQNAKIDISDRFSLSILEFRSNNYSGLLEKFEILKKLLDIDDDFATKFLGYLKKYLNFLELENYKEFTLIDTSFGNIWHTFCYFNFGSLNNITDYYLKKLKIDSSIATIFTFNQRQVLVGQTIYDEFLIGEDIVDISKSSILPYSLKILDQNKNWLKKAWNDQLYDLIDNSETLIIPNGSIANWIALINSSFQVRELLVKKSHIKPIIMFSNLFYSQNEFPIEAYLELLVDNYGIKIDLLTPDSDYYLKDSNSEILGYYELENKKPNRFYNNIRLNFLNEHNNLNIIPKLKVELNIKKKGLKYENSSIRDILNYLV
jgi:hypothetical protein